MTDADKTTDGPATGGKLRKTALAFALLAGTTLGGFTAGHYAFAANDDQQPSAPVNQGAAATPHEIPDFADLVAKVKPAVVSVTTKLDVHETSDEGPMQSGPMPFPFGQMPNGGMQQRSAPSKPAARASSSTPTAPSSPTTTW